MKKTLFICIVAAAVSAMLTVPAGAEANSTTSAELTTETTAVTVSAETEPVTETTPPDDTAVPSETGEDTDGSSTEEAATTELKDNPRLKEELSEDLYKYLMKYLENPSDFEFDGQGVLINESVLNPSSGEKADETTSSEQQQYNSHETVGNGEKTMYTVATRDGSIFYIIVDKSGDTENVYFLNAVDVTDLAAIIQNSKEEDEGYTPEELEIINQAGETVTIKDENNPVSTDKSGTNPSQTNNSSAEESGDSSMGLYIVVGVIGAAIIGFAAYKKIGPGKKKKADFDEVDDDSEEEVVEDYVVDDNEVISNDYGDETEETEELDDTDNM